MTLLSTPLLPRGWAPLLPPAAHPPRVVGGIITTWLGVVLAVLGALLTPLRAHGVFVPVALPLAAGGNWLLMVLAAELTAHRVGALAPGLAWLAVTFVASTQTREGDLVLTSDNWVAIAYLFVGSLGLALCATRLLGRPRTGQRPRVMT